MSRYRFAPSGDEGQSYVTEQKTYFSRSRLDAEEKYVLGVDVGTTNIRSYVYDSQARVVSKAHKKIHLLYPDETKVEIDPSSLWQSFEDAVKDSLKSAELSAHYISGLGISTQRGTFLTWDRKTGVPLHNFITWKDMRADKLCEEWNSSLKMKAIRCGSFLLYALTGNKKYCAASMLTLSSALVLTRLAWVLQNIPQVREKCDKNEVLFGTLDTWLVWKLTGGQVHATDSSNACVTGLFDPFKLEWAKWAMDMFGIPTHILPSVKCTSDSFGETLPELFGSPISINSVVGDQQASMFGQCCFNVGDANCTLGTGTFFAVNTGTSPCATEKGAFISVGWTINGETTYLVECGTSETGTIISWGQSLGFYKEPHESCAVALSVEDSGGVCFLPAYNKLKGLVPSFSCVSAFVGLRPQTSKAQLVRAMLEALCFEAYSLFKLIVAGGLFSVQKLSISGGVSNNDFIAQVLADLSSIPVTRSKHFETSSLGAAFLAGLSSGVWKNKEEFLNFPKQEKQFLPHNDATKNYRCLMSQWERTLSLCSKFR